MGILRRVHGLGLSRNARGGASVGRMKCGGKQKRQGRFPGPCPFTARGDGGCPRLNDVTLRRGRRSR
ncbi:hypothetical protein C6V06_02270 [Burkholderia gladioli]|nr:hypothetical protein C6Q13_12165 [Burkholderia gladioli]PRG57735.1 hypothetical protein C6V06_02270 [Burkholderia gladioli]